MECLIIPKDDERTKQLQSWELNEEIQIFREYLRIPTVHPNIDYRRSIALKSLNGSSSGLYAKTRKRTMRSYFKTPLADRRSLFVSEIEDQKPLVDPTMTINSFILSLPAFCLQTTHTISLFSQNHACIS